MGRLLLYNLGPTMLLYCIIILKWKHWMSVTVYFYYETSIVYYSCTSHWCDLRVMVSLKAKYYDSTKLNNCAHTSKSIWTGWSNLSRCTCHILYNSLMMMYNSYVKPKYCRLTNRLSKRTRTRRHITVYDDDTDTYHD